MAVILKTAIRQGWKASEMDRFGSCMEIRFVNSKDDKIMFRYAPNLKDKQVWIDLFSQLEEYDQAHKAMISIAHKIDPSVSLGGDCQ